MGTREYQLGDVVHERTETGEWVEAEIYKIVRPGDENNWHWIKEPEYCLRRKDRDVLASPLEKGVFNKTGLENLEQQYASCGPLKQYSFHGVITFTEWERVNYTITATSEQEAEYLFESIIQDKYPGGETTEEFTIEELEPDDE